MVDQRTAQYEQRYGCRLLGPLGAGVGQDGFVQRSDRFTAVKFFDREDRFRRELEVYQLLRSKGINQIAGHNVPEFIATDENLRAIEMRIVERPYVLDFAGAKRPKEVPDFSEEVMEEYESQLREFFEDKWTDALHVAEMFRQATGYILLDIHPGNIAFAD